MLLVYALTKIVSNIIIVRGESQNENKMIKMMDNESQMSTKQGLVAIEYSVQVFSEYRLLLWL
ncbi:MAG TPA: hypothetical protein DIT05_02100 [Morganella sp. (in: Bacteria)]|nr:hypothetical protein [Morganella sp. (in: enterobacteria)]